MTFRLSGLTREENTPYAGREHIDFAELSSKGLLLICGDTGSGKTMILDAMTLALYGKASGGLRNDFASMRCNRCRAEDDTFIEFVFEAGGNIYKFERRLEKKRVNLSEKQQISRMDEDGRFMPIREKLNKSDMPRIAEKLIGLNYDQFTQVIILPQGKFEKFLESDSGQKGEILTEIFGAGRWEEAARRYHDKVKAECDELNSLKERVSSILGSENCENLDGLSLKIKGTEEKLKEAERLRLLALAEMDNQRKRLAKEMENVRYNTTQDTIFPFLQVFDHFTMAVAAAGKSSSLESLIQGMEIIQKEFDKAFADLDIPVIDAAGKPFDPALHEAVAEEPSDTVPNGTVIRQWSRGYQCGSRLLKPAMVVVSSGPAAAEDAEKKDGE